MRKSLATLLGLNAALESIHVESPRQRRVYKLTLNIKGSMDSKKKAKKKLQNKSKKRNRK